MKRILFAIIVSIGFIVVIGYGVKLFRQKIDSALSAQPTSQGLPSPTPTGPEARQIDEAIFVPYWSVGSSFVSPTYQDIVYFGVNASTEGIDTSEDGYKRLSTFVKATESEDTLLTIGMTNSTTNFAILKDKAAQERVINEAISTAKDNNFKGIVLNIEVSALPFTSLVDQITAFNSKFFDRVHAAHLTYSITAYGDSFYRLRPFDIKKLSKSSDRVYIMAYDFSKAKGNPGPNFPLAGGDTYGYDFEHMINNYADAMPLKKITVVFGMYGYDWPVDTNDKASDMGEAISLKDIKATVLDTCKHLKCEWERDTLSSETKASYEDSDSVKHIIWFEDEASVKRKQDYLKKHGIGSFAYWAYSYF
jgi:spore germination protein YaaH